MSALNPFGSANTIGSYRGSGRDKPGTGTGTGTGRNDGNDKPGSGTGPWAGNDDGDVKRGGNEPWAGRTDGRDRPGNGTGIGRGNGRGESDFGSLAGSRDQGENGGNDKASADKNIKQKERIALLDEKTKEIEVLKQGVVTEKEKIRINELKDERERIFKNYVGDLSDAEKAKLDNFFNGGSNTTKDENGKGPLRRPGGNGDGDGGIGSQTAPIFNKPDLPGRDENGKGPLRRPGGNGDGRPSGTPGGTETPPIYIPPGAPTAPPDQVRINKSVIGAYQSGKLTDQQELAIQEAVKAKKAAQRSGGVVSFDGSPDMFGGGSPNGSLVAGAPKITPPSTNGNGMGIPG